MWTGVGGIAVVVLQREKILYLSNASAASKDPLATRPGSKELRVKVKGGVLCKLNTTAEAHDGGDTVFSGTAGTGFVFSRLNSLCPFFPPQLSSGK